MQEVIEPGCYDLEIKNLFLEYWRDNFKKLEKDETMNDPFIENGSTRFVRVLAENDARACKFLADQTAVLPTAHDVINCGYGSGFRSRARCYNRAETSPGIS